MTEVQSGACSTAGATLATPERPGARQVACAQALIAPMFIGHYGVAYAAKAVAPKAPLAAYFLAVQVVLDVLFSVFVLSGDA